ncbi:MAG: DUF368 domain-containing protein [Lachnospiraceae bacterium]|nr:DUF368 domain-containing protein [Lachnospiraceae bacterium]
MNFLKDILRGIMIGVANIIPGVSGGTMMVSMGIYDKLIGAITNIFKQFVKSVKTLLPYVVGMGIGLVGLSFVIEYFFGSFPFQTAMLFIGLIFGGMPIMLKKVRGKKADPIGYALFVLFFALIIGMQLLGENTEKVITLSVLEVIKLFAVGVVASATMVIPGVSGSMILMALGYYSPILETISGTVKALSPFDFATILHNIGIILPFGLGVLIGIYAVAKGIEYLLKKHERKTYFAILGLVFASPFAVLMGIGVGTLTAGTVIVGLLTFAVGFAVAYYLGRE